MADAEAGGADRRAELDGWLGADVRPVRFARAIRTSLRTLHIAAISVLYGGQVYGVDGAGLAPAFVAAIGSGASLALFEAWQSHIWLIQIRGVATLAKLLLALGAVLSSELRLLLLTLALVVGSVTSHMPGRYRYYSPLHGRVLKAGEKG